MAKDELKQERMKILDLLTKGTITPEDAEKLLSAIGDKNEESPTVIIPDKKAPFRMLKVYVDSADGDVVKIDNPAKLPDAWDSARPDFQGYVWYRLRFAAPADWQGLLALYLPGVN